MPKLYCDREDCPSELVHPPEDCNVNSSLAFTLQVSVCSYAWSVFMVLYLVSVLSKEFHCCLLQICRVEDISVEGTMTGSVVHFHWVRNVLVRSGGLVSASGLGNDFTSISILQHFLLSK